MHTGLVEEKTCPESIIRVQLSFFLLRELWPGPAAAAPAESNANKDRALALGKIGSQMRDAVPLADWR